MTMSSEDESVLVSPPSTVNTQHSYVDWPAIFGGIVLASAIALILLTFGSAVGLSFANFHGGGSASPVWIGIAAASWLLWVEVSSAMCGGYLAGRLRRRAHDASEHESDVRDGAHGLIVWAGATIVGAVLIASGIGAAAGAIGNIAGTAVNAAGAAAAAGAKASGFDPTAYFADALLRPAPAASGAAPAAGASGASPTPAASDDRVAAVGEAGRILANDALAGSVPDSDKTYLANLVSRTTGLSQGDATKRVDDVLSQVDAAKQKAADAAETARKAAVVAAFITAASLLVAAVGAYWAALSGGNHRDKETVFEFWFRRF